MTFVVAEIGVNWDGNLDLAKKLMENAKEAGCNAVKFQAYEEKMVTGHPEIVRLMKSTVSKTNIDNINELAKSVNIEWFCTPMYPAAVDMLDPYVKRFKVREMDGRPIIENKTTLLLEKLLKTNKEIIISCQKSPRNSVYFNNQKIKWLYCVPKYPCNFSDLDFTNIKDFHGFSNHCPHILAPLASSILGAGIIEVHITNDKSKNFVDNNVSFDHAQLKEMVKLIRLSEKIKK